MSLKFEYILKYPLMGATGFDTDETLLLIRTIEANKDAIADDEADLDVDSALFSVYLEQFAASGIDVSNINSAQELLNALNATCDLLKAAILMGA